DFPLCLCGTPCLCGEYSGSYHRDTKDPRRHRENQFLLTVFFRLALFKSSCPIGITSTWGYCFCKSGRNLFASPTTIKLVLSVLRFAAANFFTSSGLID